MGLTYIYRGESMYSTSSGRALKGIPAPLRVNKVCEESLLRVFASLRRCIECGPLTKAEIYLGSIRGRLVFLPGLPLKWSLFGGWTLDLHSLEVSNITSSGHDLNYFFIVLMQKGTAEFMEATL